MSKVFKVNKKDTIRRRSIAVVHFVRFEQTLHLVWVLLLAVFEDVQCGIGSISMLISSHIHNAAFEVFFSRKQHGAIRTDWKIYSCIFYYLCIMVTIFQVANSLSIFQQQYLLWHNTENRWKVIIYNHVKSKKSCHQKTIS